MQLSRREILLTALAGAAAGATAADTPPKVRIGKWDFSRLIVGGNPVSGNSHVSGALSREMTDYFVVGMFPKYKEQVRENCRLVGEALSSAAAQRTQRSA